MLRPRRGSKDTCQGGGTSDCKAAPRCSMDPLPEEPDGSARTIRSRRRGRQGGAGRDGFDVDTAQAAPVGRSLGARRSAPGSECARADPRGPVHRGRSARTATCSVARLLLGRPTRRHHHVGKTGPPRHSRPALRDPGRGRRWPPSCWPRCRDATGAVSPRRRSARPVSARVPFRSGFSSRRITMRSASSGPLVLSPRRVSGPERSQWPGGARPHAHRRPRPDHPRSPDA